MMTAAHFHLLVNHLPLELLTLGLLILLWGKIKNNISITQVALTLLVLGAICVIITFLSGDNAVDIIKNLPNASVDRAHEHRLAANFGLWWTIVTGVAALLGLYNIFKKNSVPKWLFYTVLLLNLFTLTVLARTNYLGGQVAHPELRS